ncbi:MAG: squalene/phytoene synthase family protein [Streptosporangiaceae bacterium]
MMPSDPVLAKASAENFPVALRALPDRYRRHLMAVYVFARTVDDAGDLADPPDRPRLLAELEADVHRLYATLYPDGPEAEADGPGPDGAGPDGPGPDGAGPDGPGPDGPGPDRPAARVITATPSWPRLPAVRGLAAAVTECAIPMRPFTDLIAANKQDQVVTRYQSFDQLLDYCTLSANPVGQLVLYVFGAHSPDRAVLSDAICTGLQITEHLQDVAEDYRNGRVYLPAEDMRRYQCTEPDLAGHTASGSLRRLIEFEAGRAHALLDAGAPLIASLTGAARLAVAGYVAGGRAALAAIAAADYDSLAATPRPRTSRTVAELARAYLRAG